MNKEPCSICEEYIEGVICDKDKCPVALMKKEIERLHKLQKPTETSGFKIVNGKVVFYTNILNGYRHEYKDLEEVVKELNLMLQSCYKCDDVVSHYKGKLNKAKSEAVREFAEKITEIFVRYAHLHNYAEKSRTETIESAEGEKIEMQSVWDVLSLKKYEMAEYEEMSELQKNIEIIAKERLLTELEKDFRLLVKEMVGDAE